MSFRIGVVTFPGSLDDRDAARAVEMAGGTAVPLFHASDDLKEVQAVILPGGFSYGDYLRSGAIAKFSPIMNEVINHANRGGYVLGVCNGFQILTESGLLPGALLHNTDRKFICKNVYITPATTNTPITSGLSTEEVYKIPIAHGEGRFYADEDTLAHLQDNEQITFQYCRVDGKIDTEHNPNGSLLNIAGITNKTKNVFGMMPHPERAADSDLSNRDGLALFESLLTFCKA